jgi:crotonobetainyl-CoA:carnitine CoA-transferase CaiB-like acyl-CoA transferase
VGAFDGVTVLEFGQFVAIPYAGQMFADGGARVIKIEPPEGEPSRHLAPLAPHESRHFIMRNRGKHSLPLDLKHPDAREIIDALLARADVVLTNMRPGLARELRLEHDQLAPRFPRVIVGNVTAFGRAGPDAGLAGMDLVVQARSGLLTTNGKLTDGLPASGDSPVADYMCAALVSFGVAAALYERERTGRGSRVEASLLMAALVLQNNLMVRVDRADGSTHAAFLDWLGAARRGGVPYAEQADRMPRSRPVGLTSIYYRTYATKDAALAIACGSPSLRRRFMEAVELKDAALDGPIADEEAHYAALKSQVEAVIAKQSTAEWRAALEQRGVPASGVTLPVEILDDPQPNANQMFHRYDHPALGPVTVLGAPIVQGEDGFVAGAPTPALGREVREILAGAGFGAVDIDRLLHGGAVSPR